VHLRRALLLFAIVLGLAAIAASLSRPPDESSERAERPAPQGERTPTVSPRAGEPPVQGTSFVFAAEREQVRRVDAGQPATVIVEVEEPGLVEIPALGVSAPGDPLTPARFELRVSDGGRYGIVFTSAAGDTPRPAGVLAVVE
jgi:hypothetical protein